MSPLFPGDPSDEELARDWTLSPDDLDEIQRCRGDENRHRFAVQLCALRSLGRFVTKYEEVPVRIVNHVGAQLDRPAVLFLDPPRRAATDSEHTQRIREHLGFEPFSDDASTRLAQSLEQNARQGVRGTALVRLAADTLHRWRVERPADSTLRRVIGSVSRTAEESAWVEIHDRVPPSLRDAMDKLLEVPAGARHSTLFGLKRYPPEPNPTSILAYLEKIELVQSLGLRAIDLGSTREEVVEYLAELAFRYDASELRRFSEERRYAMLFCFLIEAERTLLDHVSEMHRVYLTGMERRSRNQVQAKQKDTRKRARNSLKQILDALEEILASPISSEDLRARHDLPRLQRALATCRELQNLDRYGLFDELRARHSHLKRYLPAFLQLPFEAEAGGRALLAAIEDALRVYDRTQRFSDNAPLGILTKQWQSAVLREGGAIDQRTWEIGLAFAVRDGLRSGDLFLSTSRHHISFWKLILAEDTWATRREDGFRELALPVEPDGPMDRLRTAFRVAAAQFAEGLSENPFATVEEGKVHLKKKDTLRVPKSVKTLRRLIETRLPRVRIEDLLAAVDQWTGFSRELVPLGGESARAENLYPTLLAALVAHGTNLGISTMAQSAPGITVDSLQHVSRWFTDEETLKAASRRIVDYHHRLDLSSVWGDGTVSSSDGQRFQVEESTLLAGFYPRYFGYYDRAITVYTHTSDQSSVFGSQAISCSVREALYVLDGLLANDTILRPREHFTDTYGFTEQLFAICFLLGYSFMPRLKDLKDQQLYRFKDDPSFGSVDSLLRGGFVDELLIREQWDPMARVAVSLRDQTAPAHVILRRLASSPKDRLSKAITALGRLLKTTYILQYLHDDTLRERVHRQLNRGESRHQLARRLFFANQGAFRKGDYAEIMNKVSALSLLSNAALAWNTVQIGDLVDGLEARGEAVSRETLARVSPLVHRHIIPSGTYRFRDQRARLE